MQKDVGALYRKLHGGLNNDILKHWIEHKSDHYTLLRAFSDRPGIGEWLRFKATLVDNMLAGFRKVMNDAGAERMELMPNAFPPPWSLVSGMDYRRVAAHSSAISVKLYTMHWPMMLRFYGDQILKANPGLSGDLLSSALVRWLDIADDDGFPTLTDYSYPPPDVEHPVGEEAQARKINQAQWDAGETPVYVLAHGYGPIDDFRKRLQVAWNSGRHGIWVNRYAYLTDEKLEAIGEICK